MSKFIVYNKTTWITHRGIHKISEQNASKTHSNFDIYNICTFDVRLEGILFP